MQLLLVAQRVSIYAAQSAAIVLSCVALWVDRRPSLAAQSRARPGMRDSDRIFLLELTFQVMSYLFLWKVSSMQHGGWLDATAPSRTFFIITIITGSATMLR